MPRTPPPPGWPQMTPGLFYRDPAAAIDWLCAAFGFEIRLKVEGEPGEIVHCELSYGQGIIMVNASAAPEAPTDDDAAFRNRHASPLDVGRRNTQCVCMYVDDVDAHCAQAKAHGARISSEVSDHDYGDDYWTDRSYGAYDCEGHAWWFSQRLKSGPKA